MEERYLSKLSPAVDYGAGAFLLLIAVLSVVGNISVLITAFKRSSNLKPPELLSVNLAVTDLGMAITMYPLAIASAWNHGWLWGEPSCIYYGFMGFFFGIASMMVLTVMALIRFIVSTSLQSPKEKINKKKVYILIIFTWTYALVWAVFPLLGWGKYGPEPFGISCTIAWSEFQESGSSFLISMFTLCTIVPIVTIIGCYFGIARNLHVAYKSIENSNHVHNAVKAERRLVGIAVLVSVGFIGCWAPYATVSFWSMFRASDSIPPEVSMLPCLFAKSSTAYNPFIYYIFSKTFRAEIKQLTCFCGRSRNLLNMTDRGSLRESQTYVNMLKRPMDADKDKLPVNNHEAETKIQFIGCE
ncbi:opsin 8, group member b [Amia ocellicauda]|uniref:opsin 8, group member b n=1 Tax=Amia ocellicauda TaxID=2972642 RepID=UPI003464DFB9